MALWLLPVLVASLYVSVSSAAESRIHFALTKRGGRLARHEPTNLTFLGNLVQSTEYHYTRTQLNVEGNKVARKWSSKSSGAGFDEDLLQPLGSDGSWYFDLSIGTPPQSLQVDLNMLSPDFYSLMTTNDNKGSKFNTFGSTSYVSTGSHSHPLCTHPTDIFHFRRDDGQPQSVSLSFAICTPSKSSVFTLHSSGITLGLSPPSSLCRMPHSTLLKSLVDKATISNNVWSITLLDATSGVLTLGGTIAREMEEAATRSQIELEHLGSEDPLLALKIDGEVAERIKPFPFNLEQQFRWTPPLGASGWWTPLLSGLWVNGAKVLKNQPVLLDIQNPFIIAPALAAARFYEAIGGSYKLEEPYDRFWAVPCLNRPNVAFEFAGWMFPAFKGEMREDSVYGPIGGPMSLGILRHGTGYCVGVIVESRMSAAGMKDTWVLGEPFFRGTGVVFDGEGKRIGFRTY